MTNEIFMLRTVKNDRDLISETRITHTTKKSEVLFNNRSTKEKKQSKAR